MVEKMLPSTIVLTGDGNLWWAGALQKGYEWLHINNISEDDVVLIINDDTEFEENFLETAFRLMRENENILLKSWCIDKHTKKKHDGLLHADLYKLAFLPIDKQSEANCASTRGLFLTMRTFTQTGGFFPNKLPHYLSDYEFTIRAFRMGYKIVCNDELYVYSDSTTTGIHQLKYNNFSEFIQKYYTNRNTSYYKHWTNFIFLTAPNKIVMIKNLSNIMSWTLKLFIKAIIFRKSV
jgi:GT2 family glycosyltransferase